MIRAESPRPAAPLVTGGAAADSRGISRHGEAAAPGPRSPRPGTPTWTGGVRGTTFTSEVRSLTDVGRHPAAALPLVALASVLLV